MMTHLIHSDTRPGRVALVVADLARALEFYTNIIGLTLLHKNGTEAVLGSSNQPLLVLREEQGVRPWPQGYAGLYHFALLFPTRLGLADALRRLAESQTSLDGASDHGVSEALYLHDPDGHGIELYRDRAREQWPVTEQGVAMVSDPLDLHDILQELATEGPDWTGAQPGVCVGHVHLHTNQLDTAQRFYVDTLGLSLMQRFGGSALFVSAGGYHHHLGLNVWAGVGAPSPPPDAARLLWYELVVPGGLDALVARLEQAGHKLSAVDGGWAVVDPAGVVLHLVAPESG